MNKEINQEERKEPDLANALLAIIVGAASVVVTGLILWPLAMLVFDEYFELDGLGFSRNDLIFFGAVTLYSFISVMMGSIVCALLSKTNEYKHSLILGVLAVITLILLPGGGPVTTTDLITMGVTCCFMIGGSLLGARIARGIKKRKARRKDQSIYR